MRGHTCAVLPLVHEAPEVLPALVTLVQFVEGVGPERVVGGRSVAVSGYLGDLSRVSQLLELFDAQ